MQFDRFNSDKPISKGQRKLVVCVEFTFNTVMSNVFHGAEL